MSVHLNLDIWIRVYTWAWAFLHVRVDLGVWACEQARWCYIFPTVMHMLLCLFCSDVYPTHSAQILVTHNSFGSVLLPPICNPINIKIVLCMNVHSALSHHVCLHCTLRILSAYQSAIYFPSGLLHTLYLVLVNTTNQNIATLPFSK